MATMLGHDSATVLLRGYISSWVDINRATSASLAVFAPIDRSG
jgi:hypothetical protein